MIHHIYQCDNCGISRDDPEVNANHWLVLQHPITVKMFHKGELKDILTCVVDNDNALHFCSPVCFIRFIQKSIKQGESL